MSQSFRGWEGLVRASTNDIRRLTAVWRYSSIPVAVRENVAEHSYWVALYAAMIHLELCPDRSALGTVVLMSLVHDQAECVTGDVVRVFKYATQGLKAEVDRAEAILSARLEPEVRGLADVVGSLAGPPGGPWNRYMKAVVKAADFMSLFQYMRREAARGNLEIIPFYNRMVSDLDEMSRTSVVCEASAEISESGFPGSFYESLHREAVAVRSDCFHGLEEDARWTRPV